MKKTLLSIMTIFVLIAILTVSAFAASTKQTYVYKEPIPFLKMTGSLNSYTSNGSYIRTAYPITRTDVIGSASVTEAMYARLNARLYVNYTAGPTSGSQKVNIYSDGFVRPGNYIRLEKVFEASENVIKTAGYHLIYLPDGSFHTLTQGHYLSGGQIYQDNSATTVS